MTSTGAAQAKGGFSRSTRRYILSWVIIALVLRVAYILLTRSYEVENLWTPEAGFEMGRLAKNISNGDGLSLAGTAFVEKQDPVPTAWFGPIYPAFLAIFFWLFGSYTPAALLSAQMANSIVGALTAIPIFALTHRIFGQGPAKIAIAGWALFPHAIVQTSYLWHGNVLTFLLCVGIWAMLWGRETHSIGRTVLVGGLFGAIVLVDGAALSLIPVLGIWLVSAGPKPLSSRVHNALLLFVVTGICILPWTVRNYYHFREVIPLRSSFGLNLFIGNNWEATGKYQRPREIIARHISAEERAYLAAADEYEYSQFLGAKAKEWISANPGRFAVLTAKRGLYFWLPELSEPKLSSPRWGLRLSFAGPLLALALVGFIVTVRRRETIKLVHLVLLFYPIAYYIAVSNIARYRYPMIPFQLMLASAVLCALYYSMRGKLGLPGDTWIRTWRWTPHLVRRRPRTKGQGRWCEPCVEHHVLEGRGSMSQRSGDRDSVLREGKGQHLVTAQESPSNNGSFKVLGVRVDAVQIPDVVDQMERWIGGGRDTHYIAVTGMHGVTEAQQDPTFRDILNSADLVVPDGMPLVWLSHLRGFSLKRRVYGPELMLTFCERTSHKGYRHFFYGGAPGVPQQLAETLQTKFSGLRVAGAYSPPFRPLTSEEKREIVARIRRCAPDVLWVGLSTPKQERWMYEYRNELNVPVLVGVGAAFDLNTGRVRQAPAWMREHGLEWFYRLLQEPKRLWRRYLVQGSTFVCLVMLEALGLKKLHKPQSSNGGIRNEKSR